MKVKINKLYKSDKDKQGNPLTTKDGRLYTRIAIQVPEYGAKWISGFLGNWNSDWKIGDKIDIDIEQSGEYLNFKKPDPVKALEARVQLLEDRFDAHISKDTEEEFEEKEPEEPDEVRSEDIPF